MKRLGGDKRPGFKPRRFTTIVMMLIVWAGVTSALFAGITTDLQNRESLKGRAQTLANALPAEEIKQLKGQGSDLNTESYHKLKTRLQQIRAGNSDLRFVYLMGKEGEKVFFYMDSEIPGTSGYSAPGEVYEETSIRLKNAFYAPEPTIEGPSKDRWGAWMSAFAPVIDPNTYEVLALVGIDTPATTYYTQILLYAIVPLLLATIPFAGLVRDIKLQAKEYEILHLKEQFVSIASHELRSPLAGMLWAIQALGKSKDRELSEQQQKLLGDMYRSTESSLTTVNEILDMSIFERGKAQNLQHETVDMVQVLSQVAGTLQLGAQEKKIRIELTGKWPQEALVIGDVAAFKRAFMNIVSNAIKYSREQTAIELSLEANDHEYIFNVCDHGIGIPPEEQPKVLQGYYRATNATVLQANGTGLGLWVTKQIIEQHGGRLWLRSKLNMGTTIYVALPKQKRRKA